MIEGGGPAPRVPGTLRWVVAGVALALLLAASGAGVFRGFDRADTDTGTAVRHAAVGALIGAAIAAVILATLAWSRQRRGVAAGALSGGVVAALLALLIGAAATLGAATAPPETSAPPRSRDETEESDREDGSEPVEPFGGAIDAETGDVYVDMDGDGLLDLMLVPCPPRRPVTDDSTVPDRSTTTTTIPPYRVGDKVRVAIDEGCDGVIDRYLYVTVRENPRIGAGPDTDLPDPARPEQPDEPGADESDGGSSGILGIILLVVAGVVIVALIVALLRGWNPFPRRSRPVAPLPPPTSAPPLIDETAAADSLATSARRLRDDPDPRRAIIAAYAELLDGLAAAGAERAPYEAPEEHLQRSLRQLGVPPESLSEVTRLFLVARFSRHPLGEAERHQALRALNDAEQHLRAVIAQRVAEAQGGSEGGWPE